MITVAEDGTYRMGVLAGTVTGEYEAGYLGTKARERHRQAKIGSLQTENRRAGRNIAATGRNVSEVIRKEGSFSDRSMRIFKRYRYAGSPSDDACRGTGHVNRSEVESDRLEERIRELIRNTLKRRKKALEIADSLYLTCSYEVFKEAKRAAEEYGRHLISLIAAHEMFLRSRSI